MALLNLIAIGLLSNKAFACIRDYARQKKEKKDPAFTIENADDYAGAECWQGSDG
jgi:AGCS family alanine or glycine:cation symporter